MSTSSDRAARLAAKREKLRLMREQKAQRAKEKAEAAKRAAEAKSAAESAPADSDAPASASTTNVDQLVEDLLEAPAPKLVQDAGVSYAPSPSPQGDQSSPGNTAEMPTIASLALDQRLKALSISTQVCEIHIVSQAAEKYSKGTQTDGNPDWKVDTSSGASRPGSPTARHARTASTASQGDITKFEEGGIIEEAVDVDADADDDEEKVQVEQLSPEEISNIMSQRTFDAFFDNSVRVTERAILANIDFDVLTDYGNTNTTGLEDGADRMSITAEFVSERWCSGRSVTKLSWSQNNPELLLGCYSAPAGSNSASDTDWSAKADPDGLLLVWSTKNRAAPEYIFTAQSPVLTGMFHPFSPNLLIGSTYSGQICLWDIRARRSPIQKTQLSAAGHTHPVYSMHMVGSQNAHGLVTISTNGKLCQWDTSQLVTPTESLTLSKIETHRGSNQSNDSEVAVTSCAFAHGETNTFFVGAETGTLYDVEMHGSPPGVQNAYNAHHALVSSMQFHPQTDVRGSASDVLLTSSFDWTLKLWNFKRSRDKPLHTFSASSDYIFDARWSPVHPSLLVSGDGSGTVDLWDLCTDMEVPVHRLTDKSNHAISSLAWSASGLQVGAGYVDGRIALIDVNPHIALPGPNAHSTFTDLLSSLPVEDFSVEEPEEMEDFENY